LFEPVGDFGLFDILKPAIRVFISDTEVSIADVHRLGGRIVPLSESIYTAQENKNK